MIVAFTPPSVCLWHVKKDVIHAWIVHCWNVSRRIVYCEIGQSTNVLYSEKILLHCFYVFGHLEFFLAVNLYKNMWKQYSSDRLWMFSKIFSKSFVWHLDQKKSCHMFSDMDISYTKCNFKFLFLHAVVFQYVTQTKFPEFKTRHFPGNKLFNSGKNKVLFFSN